MKTFDIVVAMDKNRGIGIGGQLPWHLPADLRHFKELTTVTQSSFKQNAVIMGRKTWESLPKKFKPLPRRINIVLTRNSGLVLPQGVVKADGLENVLSFLKKNSLHDQIEKVFVIGGEEIFRLALAHPSCQKIHMTEILHQFACDTYFPEFKDCFKQTFLSEPFQETSLRYHFSEYSRL